MKRSIDNQQQTHSRSKDIPDLEFAKLEELWDRQIMKGDDDSFDHMGVSKSYRSIKKNVDDNGKNAKPVSKRRGRRI